MKISQYSFEIVEQARDYHDQGLGPVAIQKRFKKKGYKIPRDTIADWVYFKTRIYF